jgi:hypothetical protein
MKRRDTVGFKMLRPIVKATQVIINNDIQLIVKKQKLNPPESNNKVAFK